MSVRPGMEPVHGDSKLSETTEATGAGTDFFSGVAIVWEWLERLISSIWSGLGWPHAVLIIFLLTITCYRLEFKALIERVLEFGPSGVKLQAPVFQAPLPDRSEPIASGAIPIAKELPPAPRDKGIPLPPTIVFPEQMRLSKEAIMREVADMSDLEAKSYLIPMLAMARSMFNFEFCYSCIFGGQIRLLQMLNQRPGRAIAMNEVYSYWNIHQEQTKPVLNLWTADQYLSYLFQNGLVERMDDTLRLTTKGAEFVLWMTQYGRPLDRPW